MKKIFLLLLLSGLSHLASQGCTIVVSDDGTNVYVGNNEDFLNNRKSRIWFEPASGQKYGAAFWGFNYFPFKAEWIPQGGINEHGLFFDRTSVPEEELEKEKGKKNADPFFLNRILFKCKTVEEVLDLINQYNLKSFSKGQILIADKTGNYAILDNNNVSLKKIDYAVATNFRVSAPELGGFPSKEYSAAMKMLANNPEASISNFVNILDEVHQVNSEVSTIYSQVIDLKKGVINLFHFHDFEHPCIINLGEELMKGKHSLMIADLFPKRIVPLIIDSYLSSGLESTLNNLDDLNNSDLNFCESELFFFADYLFEHFLFENTIDVCDKILEYYPNSDETLLLKGKCLVYDNKIDKSVKLIEKAIDINPYNFNALRILDQIESPKKDGNTSFVLEGHQDATFVSIVMSSEKWEDLIHIMYRDGDKWRYSCDLVPGTYEYIYKIDGTYYLDPTVKITKEYPTTTVMILEKDI